MTEGYRVVPWMIEHDIWPTDEVFVHSEDIVRGPEMRADIALYFRFKGQKSRTEDRLRATLLRNYDFGQPAC